MAKAGGDLKAWLTGLDDVRLRDLMLLPGPLAHWVGVPHRGGLPRLGRRELLSARVWLSRSQTRDLKQIADAAADFGGHLLVSHGGFQADPLREPSLDALEPVIVSLPPVLARLTLYSMLLGDDTPRRAVAEQSWDRLLEAAERPGTDWGRGEDDRGHIHAEEEAAEQAGETAPDSWQRQVGLGDAVPQGDAADVPVAVGPAEALRRLRSCAAELVAALELAAEQVAGGFELPQGLLDRAATWPVERSAAADLIREAGRNWSAEGGFSDLEAAIAQLVEDEERETAHAHQLAMLREQRQALLPLVDKAGQGSGGAYLESLRETLRTLDEEIAVLSPTVSTRSQEPHAPASPAAAVGDTSQSEEVPPVESSAGAVEMPTAEAGCGPTDVPVAVERTEASPAADASRSGALAGAAARPDAPPPADGTEDPAVCEVETSGPSAVPVEACAPAEAERPQETGSSEQTCLPWHATAAEGTARFAPSHVERLVGTGRFQEAYWMTVGSGEPVHRADCLAFADAAFSCTTPEDATPVMTRFTPDLERVQNDRPALVLAAVASVRAGLVVGWPNDLLLQTDPCSFLSAPWSQLLECAIGVLRHYHRVDPATLHPGDDEAPTLTRSGIAKEAGQLKVELPMRKIGYARATQVQNLLMHPEQPLGRALDAVHDWASQKTDASVLEEAWQAFRKRDSSERMIEEADAAIRTPKQAKEPIEAKAKRSLLSRIERVANLLSRARALAAPEVEARSDTLTVLSHALARVRGLDALPGVEGAALLCLRRWLEGEQLAPISRTLSVIADESGLGADSGLLAFADYVPDSVALLAAPDLPRTPGGAPDTAAPGFAEAVASLLEPVEIPAVLTTYAERGDLHLADALVEALEQGLLPAAAAGTKEVPSGWRTERDAQWARWSNTRTKAHRIAAGLLAELRTQQSLDDLAERDLVGRLAELEQPFQEGAFRSTIAAVRRLEEDLRGRVDAYVQRLRTQLETLPLSEKDHKQITSLLEAGDTVTAEECLAILRKGDVLPEWSGADRGEDLDRFVVGLETVAPVKAGQQGFSALPWAEHYADGQPLTEGALAGLESWNALSKPSTRGAEWQKHVPSVLRLLGLEGRPPSREDSRQVRGILRLTAKLRASENIPGYVADLGSAATTYTVLVVSDEQRGRSPLELLDRGDSGTCIILYLYPLGLGGRRSMALRARTSVSQALVVDPAVFGWVAARSPRSFRAAQRVTLPWTGFNPYTPFVAGLVPPEVFYGRTREMAAVTNPLGALFLYGGRQLGKSALLRKVEADFPSSPEHKAVYLDLKARGVGEAEPADRIWPVLATELKRVGVLGPKVSTAAPPDVLSEQVRRWLEENRERRVLVLADEADAFLTADSKTVRGSGGEGTFANVARLKGLMDSTDRRFKVVFAGLHQVQRFSRLSNVPLAHGGEVLIGPLKPAEAQRLVVEPMAAFGYRFERPELVWRVLAATNYQACLVQIFCERLVTALREKPLGSAQWPITVTEEDIRAVAGSAEVHRHIAERLRLTINLEDRYRVLALAIALRSQADGFHRGYDADELLSEAKRNWPEGFRRLTASDVKIYLEEMVGLGLLSQQADRRHYAVRSPNVVHMLGTREDLELELKQTEFSLPYDYNPRFSRRLLGTDRSGVSRYSPLTEQQLYEATGPGLTLVCLTKAHSPELITPAISSYADARGLVVHNAAPDTLVEVLTRTTRSREPSVVVADLRYCGLDTLRQALERLRQHTVGPKGAPPRAGIALVDPRAQEVLWDERSARVLRPERWNADSLRAWPECPFDTPDKRERLMEATGGWPGLVERTVDLATRGGATLETALETTRAQCSREGVARDHLNRIELDRGMRDLLVAWVQYIEPGECCNRGDIAAVTGLGLNEVRRFTDRLADHGVLDDSEKGYGLDLVTFRALNSAGQGS